MLDQYVAILENKFFCPINNIVYLKTYKCLHALSEISNKNLNKILKLHSCIILLESQSSESTQSARVSLQSSELASPAPSPTSECRCRSPLWFQEGTHSLGVEGTEGANSDKGIVRANQKPYP
jgi:hypothetical protein